MDAYQTALEHHRGGRLADAEREYQSVTPTDPNYANALFLQGAIALESGRVQAALEPLSRAAALAPDNAAYQANLGEVYRRLGRLEEAIGALIRAMSLRPDLAEPTFNLGLLLEQVGEVDSAVACFDRANELKPGVPVIVSKLEAVRARRGKNGTGRPHSPPMARLLLALGQSLSNQGRHESALTLCRRALELSPKLAAAHHGVGVALGDLLRIDESVASFRRALALAPEDPDALNNLGVVLARTNELDEAIEIFRRSLALRGEPRVHSNLLFAMHFHPGYDAPAILAEAREFDRRHARPLASAVAPHENDRAPDRRLRIGYLSAHFKDHCQSLFTTPLFRHHDREQFEVHCYSAVAFPDSVTPRVLAHADAWRSVAGLSAAAIAEQVRADGVDILVDLTMHMEHNQWGVLARKPAPVQVAWLAYPGTTGLRAIDYRLTDPFLDPGGGSAQEYSEQPIVLPDTFWCYEPLSEAEVGPLPAASAPSVTFGCLNNFCKVHDGVLELWARVLREVAGSRLVLLAPLGRARGATHKALAALGVARERITFVDRMPRPEYLATYRGIDVCLDTVPYNGHTTSLDAFWMGVPVVTLVGHTVVGRAGLSQATNLGLPELLATSPDEFVQAAVTLARDRARLGELRAGLRARMVASPLMDAARFARGIEAGYREIWRRWSAGEAPRALVLTRAS